MLIDPRRSYLLDMVSYVDEQPLLKLAAYLFVGVGALSVIVGFCGCCGAIQESPCMLVTVGVMTSQKSLFTYAVRHLPLRYSLHGTGRRRAGDRVQDKSQLRMSSVQ